MVRANLRATIVSLFILVPFAAARAAEGPRPTSTSTEFPLPGPYVPSQPDYVGGIFDPNQPATREEREALIRANTLLISINAKNWQATQQTVKAILDDELKKHPNSVAALNLMSQWALNEGWIVGYKFVPKYLTMATDYNQRALAIDPHFGNGWVSYGHIQQMTRAPGFLDRAERAFKTAEKYHADSPVLYSAMTGIIIDRGSYKEGWKRCLTIYNNKHLPKDRRVGILVSMAHIARLNGNYELMDAMYEKLIDVLPDAWSYGDYGHALLCFEDQPDRAIYQLQIALKKMNYGMAWWNLAAAYDDLWARDVIHYRRHTPPRSQQYFDAAYKITQKSPPDAVAEVCTMNSTAWQQVSTAQRLSLSWQHADLVAPTTGATKQ